MAQLEQEFAPETLANLPAEQLVQLVDFSEVAYLPEGQLVQRVAAEDE